MKEVYDVLVVGGGASGMTAAIAAARNGKKVAILEKNDRLGKKLSISGGGRCNITNATYDLREMLKNYGSSEKFLYSSFSQFGVADTFSFFSELRLPLIVEARNRAFPFSHKATDVTKVLERELHRLGVEVFCNETVSKFSSIKLRDTYKITNVQTRTRTYETEHVIFATGGISHPETGSTGDGYSWLQTLGHTVVAPTPTLVPLASPDTWIHEMSGTAFENIRISFFVDGVKKISKVGKILCTHFGLSGPQILNLSKQVSDLLHEGVVTTTIETFPDIHEGQLDEKILKIFNEHKNKLLKSVVKEFIPEGFETVFKKYFITPELLETPVHSITVVQRKAIVKTLKALPCTINGLMGADRAIIADGGVSLLEIDMRTMKSLKVSNLSITGDLLHIMRPSGGFSLQLCWTTGFVAGNNI